MASRLGKILSVVFVTVWMAGCAATIEESRIVETPRPIKNGVYHKVGKGQTLWRIAETYNVPINDIILSNNIPDVAKVEHNQLIFIPGADRARDIVFDNKVDDGDFIWPLKGKVLRYFREPQGGVYSTGVDIAGQEGEAVKAARSGTVVLADYLSGYGYTVVLDHGDGYHSVYGQNAKLLVDLGNLVRRGDQIAYLGKKRDSSFLHFEIRKNSVADNPLYYLP